MIRQLSKAIFPTLERDLSSSINKQVATIDDLMLMAPRVFSYQNKASGSATVGAFGRTVQRRTGQKSDIFIKVEKKIVSKGLFHD
jgi:hypothetical protein